MSHDPVTGPVPRDEFKALVDAPFGAATKVIRKYDPQFGRKPGEKFEWRVTATSRMTGHATIKASSEKEADDEIDKLTCNDFDWDTYSDDFDVVSVEPTGKP